MSFKKLSELSDADVRELLYGLIVQMQELEIHLAETALLTLFGLDEVEEPGEQMYAETVNQLASFLSRVTERLKAISDATERIAEQRARNN